MKIDWKSRSKNKAFWMSLIGLLLVLFNQVASVFGYDVTIYNDKITDISESVLAILALLGIIIDPTTQGIGDGDNK